MASGPAPTQIAGLRGLAISLAFGSFGLALVFGTLFSLGELLPNEYLSGGFRRVAFGVWRGEFYPLLAILLLASFALLGGSGAARGSQAAFSPGFGAAAITLWGLGIAFAGRSHVTGLFASLLGERWTDCSRALKLGGSTVAAVASCLALFFIARAVLRGTAARGSDPSASRAPGTALRGLAVLTAIAVGAAELWYRAAEVAPGRPNVLLISIDTLRADHLGCYGYEQNTSPHIDALAEQGVLFLDALSQAPWTLPAMATVHTSLYPSRHAATSSRRILQPRLTTLAEVFREGGYRTVAVVSHRFVSERYGFAQGFESFDERHVLDHQGVSSQLLTTAALEHARDLEEPFLLWVHYFDPHFSYVRHDGFEFASGYEGSLPDVLDVAELEKRTSELSPEDVQYVRNVYDEEIAFTDRCIGELLDGLRGQGRERGLVVALTADHGEYFMERGRLGHGKDVYRELTHVPLIVSGAIDPALRGTTVEQTVEVANVARTLAAVAGLDAGEFRGEDLLAFDPEAPRFSFSEGNYAWGDGDRSLGVVWKGWKLVRRLDAGGEELYRLPDEHRDRIADGGDEVRSVLVMLRAALDRFREVGEASPTEIELDEDEIRHLSELGYTE